MMAKVRHYGSGLSLDKQHDVMVSLEHQASPMMSEHYHVQPKSSSWIIVESA